MLGLIFAFVIGMTHFGNHDEIPAPIYNQAPLTWEDSPEYMLEAGHLLPGDDNGDGVIMEDESGWNCRTMGNRICGPVN